MKKLRVYADTSVFGGCFDEGFSEESLAFFEEVRQGKYTLVISRTTLAELNDAPERVKDILFSLPEQDVEYVANEAEITRLTQAYLDMEVVGPSSRPDAEHIAAATAANVDLVVSWNFKHMVHYDKIRGYNAVNMLNGYRELAIYSPREVIEK